MGDFVRYYSSAFARKQNPPRIYDRIICIGQLTKVRKNNVDIVYLRLCKYQETNFLCFYDTDGWVEGSVDKRVSKSRVIVTWQGWCDIDGPEPEHTFVIAHPVASQASSYPQEISEENAEPFGQQRVGLASPVPEAPKTPDASPEAPETPDASPASLAGQCSLPGSPPIVCSPAASVSSPVSSSDCSPDCVHVTPSLVGFSKSNPRSPLLDPRPGRDCG